MVEMAQEYSGKRDRKDEATKCNSRCPAWAWGQEGKSDPEPGKPDGTVIRHCGGL
jgi:hypothetical protein